MQVSIWLREDGLYAHAQPLKALYLTVETDMTDTGTGTGSYTIIAQTVAEVMGLTQDKVAVRLGNSNYPVSAGSGGQWSANSSTSGD